MSILRLLVRPNLDSQVQLAKFGLPRTQVQTGHSLCRSKADCTIELIVLELASINSVEELIVKEVNVLVPSTFSCTIYPSKLPISIHPQSCLFSPYFSLLFFFPLILSSLFIISFPLLLSFNFLFCPVLS